MKHTDGMFHKVFDRVAAEYPDIENDHRIIDIGTAVLANRPETLDVVVSLNLYGDILSDIASEITGSVGLGGSANVGEHISMFEAVHGSAPDIAGQNIANPSGLLNGAIMMLVQMGKADVAEKIQNAWLKTLEDGLHTGDIYREDLSKQKVGTREFADAIIERLGQNPETIEPVKYGESKEMNCVPQFTTPKNKELQGVDVFIDWSEGDRDSNVIGKKLEDASTDALQLKMITNRGVKVYPGGFPETFCTDHWRCRFINKQGGAVTNADVIALLQSISAAGLDFIKTEHLYTLDGERAYSLGQGE
jgi:isocitrate dehydrogenase